jgi:hypothetical protein
MSVTTLFIAVIETCGSLVSFVIFFIFPLGSCAAFNKEIYWESLH